MKQNRYILDEEGFLRVVEQNKAIITKICYFYAHDPEEFKDLRQDVLAAIWHARERFKGEASTSTWIYRISLNTCVSAMRKRNRWAKKVPIDNLAEIQAEFSDREARYSELHALINRLKGDDKAIILLWLDELPYEEIASIMGIPRNTLATKLRRIKQSLSELARHSN